MAAPPPQPPARGGLSLYANLLEDSSTSISRDPVLFKDGSKDDTPAKKAIDPALRFQPIRRPQVKQPNKPKPGIPKAPPAIPAVAAAAAANGQPRSTLADWAATEEDEYIYGTGEKRQRGGRKKKKKKAEDVPRETDWDEIYDPARPTNVEEYLHSEERIREVQDWKAVLYAHRRQRRKSSYDSDVRSDEEEDRSRLGNQFAPPASLTFAPPPLSPPRADAPIADPATGDDAYARRLAMSGMAPPAPAAPPPPASPTPPPPPPPPPESAQSAPPPQPATDAATISRAPVRYEVPPPPPPASEPTSKMDLGDPPSVSDEDEDDAEVDYSAIPLPPSNDTSGPPSEQQPQRSSRPGQAGFAQRLMAKYGWTKGSGLGASESGITSALRVQVDKRRRRPDAEGGGFAEPGGRGRIIMPKGKSKNTSSNNDAGQEEGGGGGGEGNNNNRFGKTSVVVVLRDMLDNMPDLAAEVEAGLGQEIGEECGERYGRVERVFIDVAGRRVFIKFTEAVSALRAVNALEGRIFNGNSIVARFYDEDKFEEGVYDA
ncbi:hypothetical protein VTK56DRAFT_6566 [Thermocarpiscus australiensis]